MKCNHRFIHLIRQTSGSITIEATLIMPLCIFITLIMIFASLFVYQKAGLYYTASVTAERTAYVWDNSYKHPVTGAGSPVQHDGLYWRITKDNLSDIFSFIGVGHPVTVRIHENDAAGYYSLPHRKLQRGAQMIVEGITGKMTYRHSLFFRKVEVELEKWLHMPLLAKSFLGDRMRAKAESGIVEPAEWIRLVNVTRTYVHELTDRGISEQKANEAFHEFLHLNSPSTFANHQEAHAYLLQLVDGTETSFPTSHGVRMVDAMDHRGIVHQAYVTFNENQIRLQMAKDIELLQKGDPVKGVVWHFFRRTGQTGKVGPSDQLRRELEEKGIVIVIHD